MLKIACKKAPPIFELGIYRLVDSHFKQLCHVVTQLKQLKLPLRVTKKIENKTGAHRGAQAH